MMSTLDTHYAKSDDVPSFSRLIRFEKRGTGLSDRMGSLPTLEERMDDVRAVMDATGSKKAALLGFSEGGPMSMVFAATYPQRTTALLLYGCYARAAWAADYPGGRTEEQRLARGKMITDGWGQGNHVAVFAPSFANDSEYRKWQARNERASASPGAALELLKMNMEIDVRHVLQTVAVPTLVLHRTGDRVINIENGRYLARNIKGAKYMNSQATTTYRGPVTRLRSAMKFKHSCAHRLSGHGQRTARPCSGARLRFPFGSANGTSGDGAAL